MICSAPCPPAAILVRLAINGRFTRYTYSINAPPPCPGKPAGCQNRHCRATSPSFVSDYLVIRHFRERVLAENSRVHERKVRHIEKILDDTRRRRPHVLRREIDRARTGRRVFGEEIERVRRLAETYPHHAVLLLREIGLRASALRRTDRRIRRNVQTLPFDVVTPSVIRDTDLVARDRPERQLRATVRTVIAPHMRRADTIAPHDEPLVRDDECRTRDRRARRRYCRRGAIRRPESWDSFRIERLKSRK